MWIKAILCTKDTVYAERLAGFFDREYGNKIELNICSSMEEFFDFIDQYRTDVALFDDALEREAVGRIKDIPCTCAVITEQMYEGGGYGLPQIHQFQRGDRIYKNILDLYSTGEKVKRIGVNGGKTGNQKVYVFTSASGGSGTSTIAKAYAKKCAAYEKVLYLDLGLFNLAKVAEGNADGNANGLDEIILALKSRRNILPLKLMSAVSSTMDRVFTYGPCSNEMNLLELDAEDMRNLIDGVVALSEYQKIIVDIGSAISLKEIELMKRADVIVCVVDESDIGKQKYEKFCLFLENAGNKEQMRIIKKMLVFRNKIRQGYDNGLGDFRDRMAGWAPYVSVGSYDAVVDRISQSDSFSNLEIRNAE